MESVPLCEHALYSFLFPLAKHLYKNMSLLFCLKTENTLMCTPLETDVIKLISGAYFKVASTLYKIIVIFLLNK